MSRKLHEAPKRFAYVAGNIPVGGLIRLFLLILLMIFVVGKLSARSVRTPPEAPKPSTPENTGKPVEALMMYEQLVL